MDFNIAQDDGDVPMWEPQNWAVRREQQTQRQVCIPVTMMENLTQMRERQYEEIVIRLRGTSMSLQMRVLHGHKYLLEVFAISLSHRELSQTVTPNIAWS